MNLPWLPTQLTSEDLEMIDMVLAAQQPHLKRMAQEVAHIEDLHDMAHLHPLSNHNPAVCQAAISTVEAIEAQIDRGIRAMYC